MSSQVPLKAVQPPVKPVTGPTVYRKGGSTHRAHTPGTHAPVPVLVLPQQSIVTEAGQPVPAITLGLARAKESQLDTTPE